MNKLYDYVVKTYREDISKNEENRIYFLNEKIVKKVYTDLFIKKKAMKYEFEIITIINNYLYIC